jgi:hypothetical protein
MQPKRLTAAVLCAVYAVLVFGVFCFVITDGFTLLALNGSLDGFNPARAFDPPLYRLTAIAGAVLVVFVVLDAIAVLNEQQEWFGDPPPAYPLAYAAMRLRRYALIPLGLGYALLLLSWVGTTKVLGTSIGASRENVTIFATVLLAALFCVSRRPINWAPTHVFQTVLDFAGGVAKGFSGR